MLAHVSTGILFYELFHRGQHPYHTIGDSEFARTIGNGEHTSVSMAHPAVGNLVNTMLRLPPQDRPTASEVRQTIENIASGQERWEFTGKLTFIRELGSGQFGNVDQMVAHDLPGPGDSTVVAVKTLLDGSSPEAEAEFFAEV